METSYKKLWKLLIDLDMSKTELRLKAGISTMALAKLGKNENVSLWHGSSPISQIDNIRVNSFNYAEIKNRLLRSLLSLGSTFLASPSPYYRHTYGASYSV